MRGRGSEFVEAREGGPVGDVECGYAGGVGCVEECGTSGEI